MSKKRLLIVENGDQWRRSYQNLLEDDYELHFAASHAAAEGALLRDGPFDGTILDLELDSNANTPQNLDGLYLLESLNAKRIPTLIVSDNLTPRLTNWIHPQYPWVYKVLTRNGLKADGLTSQLNKTCSWQPTRPFKANKRPEREREVAELIAAWLKDTRVLHSSGTPPAGVVINNAGGVIGGSILAGNTAGHDLQLLLSPADVGAIQAFARHIRDTAIDGVDPSDVSTGVRHLEEIAASTAEGHSIEAPVSNWRRWLGALAPKARAALSAMADVSKILGTSVTQLLDLR
jgi:CheY-like chemotaxis protein